MPAAQHGQIDLIRNLVWLLHRIAICMDFIGISIRIVPGFRLARSVHYKQLCLNIFKFGDLGLCYAYHGRYCNRGVLRVRQQNTNV